jgi:hypothetical protein
MPSTPNVQSRVAQVFEQFKALKKPEIQGLQMHAGFMREIRNYGVHPRSATEPIESHFTEEAAAFIILATRHYLVLLRDARGQTLEKFGATRGS